MTRWLTYTKTGTAHLVHPKYSDMTLCAIDIDNEKWKPVSDAPPKKRCKRCLVSSGVPGRQVYDYSGASWY